MELARGWRIRRMEELMFNAYKAFVRGDKNVWNIPNGTELFAINS
jgi:hypothetical protein